MIHDGSTQNEYPLDKTNIVAMPTMSQRVAEKIIAIMVERGLLAECTENGEKMYTLTEKGEQMGREAKQKMLQENE